MASPGSKRWPHGKREIVENCSSISAGELIAQSCVRPWSSGHLTIRSGCSWCAQRVPCRIVPLEDMLILTFPFESGGERLQQIVPLATTRNPHGGARICFACPVPMSPQGEGYCGRLTRKLYRPQARREFGCRRCFDLTYGSAQRRNSKLERLARDPDKLIEILARFREGLETAPLDLKLATRLLRAGSIAVRREIAALRRSV